MYFKDASGLPPHVLIYAAQQRMQKDLDKLPNVIEARLRQLLDEQTLNGQLTLDQLRTAVENGAMMQGLVSDMAEIKQMLAAGAAGRSAPGLVEGTAGAAVAANPSSPNLWLARQYNHGDNVYRRVPKKWKFPKLGLQALYGYWHCGSKNDNIPPMKWLTSSDIAHLGKRPKPTLSEMKREMGLIDKQAKLKGMQVRDNMTRGDINTLYVHGEDAVREIVPEKTAKGRERNIAALKFSSIATYMINQNK